MHMQAGNYGEAEKSLRLLLEESKERKKSTWKVGGIHLELASVLVHLGKPDEAETQIQQATSLIGHATTPSLQLSARIATMRGDHTAAQEFLKQALNREEKLATPDLGLLGRLHQELAQSCIESGDMDAAEKHEMTALDRFEQLHGASHTAVATARWILGDIYLRVHKYQLAMACFEAAMDVHRRTEGPDSPLVTRDLNSLAQAAMETGDVARAASEYERTLILMERQLGTNPTDRSHVLLSLARIYEMSGQPAKAQESVQQAITILERKPGRELAEALELMARQYIRTGRYMDALPRLDKAQAIWTAGGEEYAEQFAANQEQQNKIHQQLAEDAQSRQTSVDTTSA